MNKIFTCLLLCLAPSLGVAQYYPATTYSTVDGMPTNSIFDVGQTQNMVMWFLTSKGVVTYDANTWELFPDTLELPISDFSYLKVDESDRVWVAGYNRSEFVIKYFENDQWNSINIPERWFNTPGAFSFEVGADKIWLTRIDRIYIYDKNTQEWELKVIPSGPNKVSITTIKRFDDSIFLSTSSGLYELRDGDISFSSVNEFFDINKTILTVQKEDSALYVLGFNWLGRYSNNEFELLSADLGMNNLSIYSKYSLGIDNRGRIFYSGFTPPSMVDLETGKGKSLMVQGRQKNALTNRIFLDKENNVWVADHRGLIKFNLLRFQNYNKNTGLIEDEVSSILETFDGEIILANPKAINILKNSEFRAFDLRNEFESNYTRTLDILQSKDGKIYFAMSSGGILVYEDGQIRKIEPDLSPFFIVALAEYNDEILVATKSAIYTLKNEQLVNRKVLNNGIRNLKVFDDQLYVLTSKGAYLLHNSDEKYLYSENPFLNNTYDIVEWNNELVLATAAGLASIRESKIFLNTDFDLKGKAAYSLLVDNKENLWIGTNDGISKWDDVELTSYNVGQGLSGNEVNRNALVQDSKGRIWIGTDLGASMYDHHEDLTFSLTPNVEITSVHTLDGTNVTDHSKNLRHSDNSIEIEFRAISFINEKGINYRYILEGFETEWNNADGFAKPYERYTNLNSGDYNFVVQARVESGGWSTPDTFSFTIDRPVYLQTWFKILSLVLVLFTLYAIYRIRFLLLINQKEKLTNQVQQRTREIEEKNTKLAEYTESIVDQKRSLQEAFDTLEKTKSQLVQSEKMAALGVLTAGVAHEINNPLNYIKSGTEVIKKIYTNEDVLNENKESETLQKVIKGIDEGVSRILEITKSLASFSRTDQKTDAIINLKNVIETSITVLRHEVKNRIEIENDFVDPDILVIGNEGKLHHLFVNLLTNAIHAIQGEGIIKITSEIHKSKALVKISDSGMGIKEEDMNRLFDPFFTTKEQGKGTGLGLSIVYNIVKEHEATIKFNSTEGTGTTVTLELKMHKNS